MTDAQIAALMGWSEEHMSRDDGPKSLEARVRALVAAAVAAERESRQEAQRRLEALQERINHADKEQAQAVDAERERCITALRIAREGYASEAVTGLPVLPQWRDRAIALIDAAIRGN